MVPYDTSDLYYACLVEGVSYEPRPCGGQVLPWGPGDARVAGLL